MNLVIKGHIFCYPLPKLREGRRPTRSFNGERNQTPDIFRYRASEEEVLYVFIFITKVTPFISNPISFDRIVLS
jgi:hypothetical protein